jgi:hypothetical protein
MLEAVKAYEVNGLVVNTKAAEKLPPNTAPNAEILAVIPVIVVLGLATSGVNDTIV